MSDEGMSNFTPRAQQVLALARKEADRFNHNFVGSEHLLLGIIKLGQGVAVNVLQKMGLDLETVRLEMEKQVGPGPDQKQVGNIPYTPRVKRVLNLASEEAKQLQHTYVGTEHILLGLLREGEGVAARVLKNLDIDIEQTRQEILKELDPNFAVGEDEMDEEGNEPESHHVTPSIRAFGRNLTKEFHKNGADPVFVRVDIIERVIQVLCRRTKNNPVLLGEAGVGKTGIIMGLVQEIAKGRVPEDLINCQFIKLDLARMFAGAIYRGQLEERIKAVVDEVHRAKNTILFIEELHMLYSPNQPDEKPNLWQIIQSVLSDDSGRYPILFPFLQSEKPSSHLSSVYHLTQFIKVEEPSDKITLEILKVLRPSYEEHHNIKITDDALEFAVGSSGEHIKERCFPSKAIDVIDEACSRKRCQVAMEIKAPTQEEMDLEDKISDAKARKERAIRAGSAATEGERHFEVAASARAEEKQLIDRLDKIRAEKEKPVKDIDITVDMQDVEILFPDR
jgi:ATP-dependent Clp protease ATP-binding subunit ClpC